MKGTDPALPRSGVTKTRGRRFTKTRGHLGGQTRAGSFGMAVAELKVKGNDHLKAGRLESACDCYSRALEACEEAAEAAALHCNRALAELKLGQAKPVAAPGVKDGGPAVREADDALDTATAAVYMRCTGKLIYFSQDRFDIMYVVRLLARALKSPTVRDRLRL